MPVKMPPPFLPFVADPAKSQQENGLAFLNWLSEGVFRAVAVGEANYRILCSLSERGGKGIGGFVPPMKNMEDMLYEVGRAAVKNSTFLKNFASQFFR